MDATLLQYVEFDLFAKLQIKNTLFCHIFVCALHIERVEHLRAGGFAQNVRREIVFDNHFAERFKFRSVDIVGKSQMLYFALCAVHDFAEMDVHILCFFFAEAVEKVVDDTLKIVGSF